jgi:eukaryotic-like serine/threonine-protein kinase
MDLAASTRLDRPSPRRPGQGQTAHRCRRQSTLRVQHPAFAGKTIQLVNVTDAGVTATLPDTNAANYLQGLGFHYADTIARTPTDTGDTHPIVDPGTLNAAPTDVRIVVRSDAGAANGYNGLPPAFASADYRGATIIVSDPNVVAALATGGYAATEYLDADFVDAIARQVH